MHRTALFLARQMSTRLSNERRRIKHYVSKDVMEQILKTGQLCPETHRPIDPNGPLDAYLDAYRISVTPDGTLGEYCHVSLLGPMNSSVQPIENPPLSYGERDTFAAVCRGRLAERLGTGQEITLEALSRLFSVIQGPGYAERMVFHKGCPVSFSVFQCATSFNTLGEELSTYSKDGSFKEGSAGTVILRVNRLYQVTHAFERDAAGNIVDGLPKTSAGTVSMSSAEQTPTLEM